MRYAEKRPSPKKLGPSEPESQAQAGPKTYCLEKLERTRLSPKPPKRTWFGKARLGPFSTPKPDRPSLGQKSLSFFSRTINGLGRTWPMPEKCTPFASLCQVITLKPSTHDPPTVSSAHQTRDQRRIQKFFQVVTPFNYKKTIICIIFTKSSFV